MAMPYAPLANELNRLDLGAKSVLEGEVSIESGAVPTLGFEGIDGIFCVRRHTTIAYSLYPIEHGDTPRLSDFYLDDKWRSLLDCVIGEGTV